jgi:hypothetical protein
MKNFTPFWWESNQIFGLIDSHEEWAKVVAVYGKPGVAPLSALAEAQEAEEGHGRGDSRVPKFGFRVECNGDLTLKDWADANQMTLQSVNDT